MTTIGGRVASMPNHSRSRLVTRAPRSSAKPAPVPRADRRTRVSRASALATVKRLERCPPPARASSDRTMTRYRRPPRYRRHRGRTGRTYRRQRRPESFRRVTPDPRVSRACTGVDPSNEPPSERIRTATAPHGLVTVSIRSSTSTTAAATPTVDGRTADVRCRSLLCAVDSRPKDRAVSSPRFVVVGESVPNPG